MRASTLVLRLMGSLLALFLAAPAALAEPDDEALGFERTPPRLSLVDGEVSFWRSGADDWAPARVNTPLAQGDELFSGGESSFEVQIGPRAYLRGGEETQLALTNLEPDYLQLRMTRGIASLDLRSLAASQTFEIDTPGGAFTIERTGYYRIEVDGDSTRLGARRGGHAIVTTVDGQTASIAPSEQVVIRGTEDPVVETYAAPELDGWDRWNYGRTDQQLDALSSRYVPGGIYGVDDLDHHGSWRVVATYGSVWFPHVAVGWAPYSAGEWIYDPYYGWTWVDAAPWGWAPFHYGRWVHVSGHWGWCPGPRVVRTYYAPALVAFYSGSHFSIGIGTQPFGWVALGWGEPLAPWWGPPHWRRVPRWAGWGGPHVVNNVVVRNTTIVNVDEIHTHVHARHPGALVAVDRGDFGRRRMRDARLTRFDAGKLRPSFEGAVEARPTPRSVVLSDRRGRAPERADLERPVVALRRPERASVRELERRSGSRGAEARLPRSEPPARVVEAEREPQARGVPRRPPFGREGGDERAAPPRPPRFEKGPSVSGPRARPDREPEASRAPESPRGEREEGRRFPAGARPATPPREELPGEPANRVFRGRRGEPAEGPGEPPSSPRDRPAQSGPREPRGDGGRDAEPRGGGESDSWREHGGAGRGRRE